MTPVLVTGGAGFIGSHTCKALHNAGFLPVSYDYLSRGNTAAVKWGELVVGDIADGRLLRDTTCSSLRRRSDCGPQAVMRKRGSAPSSTTQVSRPVANAPVSMLIRFGSTSGRSRGVCP